MIALVALAPCAAAQTISTLSGNGQWGSTGDGGPALQATHATPVGIARDAAGNIFVTDKDTFRVRRITPAGVITTVAGNGVSFAPTALGDGGPATAAPMTPRELAVDSAGNLYINDVGHYRVRRVTPAGIISTVAGTSTPGYNGDNRAATTARLEDLAGIAVDASDAIYIASGHRIRKFTVGGLITTVAGTGVQGFGGDGGPATAALVNTPAGIALDAAGNLYIADRFNKRVRKVTVGGTITTIMGGGPFEEDFFATRLEITAPTDVAVDSRGDVYVALPERNVVRKVGPTGLLGTGAGFHCGLSSCAAYGFWGDGGNALQATLASPRAIDLDVADNLYIADTQHLRIRRVTPSPAVTSVYPIGTDAFHPREAFPIASYPMAVLAGDYTGDGRKDVVVATKEWFSPRADDSSLLLYVQQGNGALLRTTTAARTGEALALADLDHDGRQDLVVGHSQGLTVYRGNAGATLVATEVPRPAGMGASTLSSVVALDADLDGHVDIVGLGKDPVSSFYIGLWLYRGDGTGAFAAPTFHALGGNKMPALTAGDINGDGFQDVLASGLQGGPAEVYLNDGAGGFRGAQPLLHGPGKFVSTGDLDDNGRTDVLLGGGGNTPTWIKLLAQGQDGRLDAPRLFPTYHIPSTALARDMNGDGRSDLVVLHDWNALGYYEHTATGFAPEAKYPLYKGHNGYSHALSMAVDDVSGDGCRDVVIGDEIEGLVVLRGKQCQAPAATADLEASGRSSLAWQLPGGTARLWPGADAGASRSAVAEAGWVPVAFADVTGDARADLVWRNCVNGNNRLAPGAGSTGLRALDALADQAWQVEASGDFDGDGHADLLWRHTTGATVLWPRASARQARRGARLATGWRVGAVGDFDGDGRDDLFWRDNGTGASLVWLAGGLRGARRATAVLDPAWRVAGAGDLDGDGRADLVWRHATTGANTAWRSADARAPLPLRDVTDPGWTIAAIGDYDGDQRADLAWRHAGRGSAVAWKRGDGDLPIALAPVPAPWRAVGAAGACRAIDPPAARSSPRRVPARSAGAARR